MATQIGIKISPLVVELPIIDAKHQDETITLKKEWWGHTCNISFRLTDGKTESRDISVNQFLAAVTLLAASSQQ